MGWLGELLLLHLPVHVSPSNPAQSNHHLDHDDANSVYLHNALALGSQWLNLTHPASFAIYWVPGLHLGSQGIILVPGLLVWSLSYNLVPEATS